MWLFNCFPVLKTPPQIQFTHRWTWSIFSFSFSTTSLHSLYSLIPHHVLSPCPFPFWTNHWQCCQDWSRPAWQHPCMDALRLSGYVCPCQGPQRRLHNVGGRRRDTNQAELSWDSMNTAGPLKRQSGSNRVQGDGQHHILCLERNSCIGEDTITYMLRLASTESCTYIKIVCGCGRCFRLNSGAGKKKLPTSRGCPGNSDIWEDATMQYHGSTLEDRWFLNVLMRPVAVNEYPSILTHREVKWSIAPVQNVGHTCTIIHVQLYLYSVV